MPLNAYLLEYGIPNYSKIMGRSYRENVPNHYVFGQFLAKNLRAKYGEEYIGELWKKTLNHATLFSFSKQINNISGLTIDKFVENQLKFKLDSLKSLRINSSAIHVSELPKKGYTSYEFPISLSTKEILAIKSGFSDIPTLVKISPDKEQFLTYLGPLYPSKMLSASSKFVVWSEITFHPRWAQKQATKLVFYELASGEKIIWDEHKKYICPSISSDSKYISLLLLNDDGSSELQIFLRETRELVRKKKVDISSQMIQPRITNDGRVVYIVLENQNKSLKIWNWDQDIIEFSKEFGNENIASPVLIKNKIYFNRPYQGVDQISSISLATGNQYIETNSPFGAYSATVDSSLTDKITYSQYAAIGNRIVSENSMAFDIMPEVPTNKLGSNTESTTFSVTKFSKLNLINLYAWGPYVNSQNNKIDFSVLSRNVINTLVLGAGYTYDANEKTGTQFVRGSYQAWFPVIEDNFYRLQLEIA